MRKKIVSVAMSAILAASMCPAAALAGQAGDGAAASASWGQVASEEKDVTAADLPSSGTCGSGLTWSLSSTGVLTISGKGKLPDFGGFGVDREKVSKAVTSVVIGEGVTYIGHSFFWDLHSVKSVSIPKTVASIANCAFEYCTSLESVVIPEGVTWIGYDVFHGCTSLKSASIPSSLSWTGNGLFRGCKSLTSVSLPKNMTYFGQETFEGCTSLKSLALPASLQEIDDYAFSGCTALESIVIPEGVERIGDSAFWSCKSLKEISIPKTVTSLGCAFTKCASLESVIIPTGVTLIEDGLFKDCTSLKSVSIPKGVIGIGDSAFENCSSLKSISLPKGLIEIEAGAFYGCSSLAEVVIPDSVKYMDGKAFFGLARGSKVYTSNPSFVKNKAQYVNTDRTQMLLRNAKQSLAVTKRVSAVSYSSLSSKTCSPIASVSGAKGELSYEKIDGADALSVDPSTGKVKVAKGTPVGEYKAKIRVNAAATADCSYRAAKTETTVTVRVTRTTPLITVSKVKAAVALPVKYDKECKPIQSATCRAGEITSYELVDAANLTTGNSTSKVRVDPLTGKVTILKGAKAGKYSLRIKLTSPETENYKSGSKTVACTVFVGVKG